MVIYRYCHSGTAPAATNRVATVCCTAVHSCRLQAIRLMKDQPSGGHIFNMDGAGADGGATPRFAAYGASMRGLAQLGKSLQVLALRATPASLLKGMVLSPAKLQNYLISLLQAELKLLNIENVGLHNLSPGMVTTELLMSGTPVCYIHLTNACVNSISPEFPSALL